METSKGSLNKSVSAGGGITLFVGFSGGGGLGVDEIVGGTSGCGTTGGIPGLGDISGWDVTGERSGFELAGVILDELEGDLVDLEI